MFHRYCRARGGYNGLTREPVTCEGGRRRKPPPASLWEHTRSPAQIVSRYSYRSQIGHPRQPQYRRPPRETHGQASSARTRDHGSFSQSCHRFAVVRPASLIRPEQPRAAACRRHIGRRIMGGAERLRCSRPLCVFVVSHDTMLIALSPWLRRPCLLAFWRQPMGGSVPLKTLASNYFPRRARPFGACARLLARRYRSK